MVLLVRVLVISDTGFHVQLKCAGLSSSACAVMATVMAAVMVAVTHVQTQVLDHIRLMNTFFPGLMCVS